MIIYAVSGQENGTTMQSTAKLFLYFSSLTAGIQCKATGPQAITPVPLLPTPKGPETALKSRILKHDFGAGDSGLKAIALNTGSTIL